MLKHICLIIILTLISTTTHAADCTLSANDKKALLKFGANVSGGRLTTYYDMTGVALDKDRKPRELVTISYSKSIVRKDRKPLHLLSIKFDKQINHKGLQQTLLAYSKNQKIVQHHLYPKPYQVRGKVIFYLGEEELEKYLIQPIEGTGGIRYIKLFYENNRQELLTLNIQPALKMKSSQQQNITKLIQDFRAKRC